MQQVNSTDFKTRFGDFVDLVRDQPIEVLRGTKPIGVFLSPEEYQHLQRLDDAYWAARGAWCRGQWGVDRTRRCPAVADRTIEALGMRKLVLNKAVLKGLDELPAKQYRQVVSAILDLLAEPCPHYSKALEGTPYRRLALGEYRVVYRADEELIHLIVAGKRNDDEVYRSLKQKQ